MEVACGDLQNLLNKAGLTFKVVDALPQGILWSIDARPGSSNLVLPASSFNTSLDNDKPAPSSGSSVSFWAFRILYKLFSSFDKLRTNVIWDTARKGNHRE